MRGFSLVELSIVLVILGLLVGGILAGQSLIRAAELRGVSTSISTYQTAIYGFRDKYFAFPGDMSNAKSFWPTCTDGTNNGCNGDGNGHIWRSGNNCTNGTASMESLRVWQHLALAGLIEGDFSAALNGATCTGTIQNLVAGVTAAPLRIGAGLTFNSSEQTATMNRKRFIIGKNYSDTLEGAFMIPAETWNMDTKLDDGLPLSGNFRGSNGHATLAQTNCYAGTAYSLTNSEQHCRILYWLE